MADRVAPFQLPQWLGVTLNSIAVVAGVITLLLGMAIFDVRSTADTAHAEDIGKFLTTVIILPYLAIGALLGLGTASGGVALSRGRIRLVPLGAIALVIIGIILAVLPIGG